VEGYEKDFEDQRKAMDERLARTYDLGQINALNTLIRAVNNGLWDSMTYENVVLMRDKLMQAMEADN
jgi:hypothetical protein